MQETIAQIADSFEKAEYSELTTAASKIATTALSAFNGELLRRALAISVAVVEFEDELKRRSNGNCNNGREDDK